MLLVITPTLGRSHFLRATKVSLSECGLDVIHVVVCPNSVLPRIQAEFPDSLVVPDSGRDKGMYGAINVGIEEVTGYPWRWFTYINDDDLLYPEFAEMYRSSCEGHFGNAAIVYGDVNLISTDNTKVYRLPVAKSVSSILPLWKIGITPFTQQGSIIRREWVERLGGFHEHYRYAGDMDFWCRAAVQGAAHAYCPKLVAGFRIRTGQLSGQKDEFDREKYEIRKQQFGPLQGPRRHLIHYVSFRIANLPSYLPRISRYGLKSAAEYLVE